MGFQPTPPKRGETFSTGVAMTVPLDFNPLPPSGGRLDRVALAAAAGISTHSPQAGGDAYSLPSGTPELIFQPTPPKRGETGRRSGGGVAVCISTHSPQAGGDLRLCRRHPVIGISTHSPQAGGDGIRDDNIYVLDISTHSPQAGGDAHPHQVGVSGAAISTHSPQAGGDLCRRCSASSTSNFNPLPPSGGRPARVRPQSSIGWVFQPTPPKRGETAKATKFNQKKSDNVHNSPPPQPASVHPDAQRRDQIMSQTGAKGRGES